MPMPWPAHGSQRTTSSLSPPLLLVEAESLLATLNAGLLAHTLLGTLLLLPPLALKECWNRRCLLLHFGLR